MKFEHLYIHDKKRPLVRENNRYERVKGPLAKMLRGESHAVLVEYICTTHTGFPVYVDFDLLRMIRRKYNLMEQVKLCKEGQRLLDLLDKHHAIEHEGELVRFSAYTPGRTRHMLRKLMATWNRYARLMNRIGKLRRIIEIEDASTAAKKEQP